MSKNKKRKKNNQTRRSSLHQHKHVGKELIPPFMHSTFGQSLSFQSWTNHRLPEMLHVALISSLFPRNDALKLYREISELVKHYYILLMRKFKFDCTLSYLGGMHEDLFLSAG